MTVGSVEREEAPHRVVKGLARHPVPVMILARLAVDKEKERGQANNVDKPKGWRKPEG